MDEELITSGQFQQSTQDSVVFQYNLKDNTGWLFAHCDEDYHHDHEMRLRAAVDSLFGTAHRNSMQGVLFGIRRVQNDDTPEKRADADQARIHFTLTDKFHNEVVDAVLAEARTRPLGYYHKNPHEAHVHEPVERAIDRVTAIWKSTTSGAADYNLVRKVVESVKSLVTTRHDYETRWDKEARIAAEKKAAEEAAESQDS